MQFIDNFTNWFSALDSERKKIFIIIGVVGIGLLLTFGLVTSTFLQSAQPEQTAEQSIEPEVTYTPEQLEQLSKAPPKPTDIPFIAKEDLVQNIPTPTLTPLPGKFYTSSAQNELEIRFLHRDAGDSFEELRLKNKITTEEITLGFMFYNSPGNSAFFTPDYKQVVYIGGTKNDYNKITFYSIPENRNLKYVTLDQIKIALPGLKIDTTSVLSRLVTSPSKSKVAFSYGNTFTTNRIAPNTQIVVLNMQTGEMQLLSVKGLVKQWKDESTLEYEVNTTSSGVNNTLETLVTGI